MGLETTHRTHDVASEQDVGRAGSRCGSQWIEREHRFRIGNGPVQDVPGWDRLVVGSALPRSPIVDGSTYHPDVRMSLQDGELLLQLPWLPDVVGIDEGDEVAGGR